MCRLYGFLANEPTKVECTLVHAQNALMHQSRADLRGVSHPDGWGIACYPDGMPVRERRAAPAHEDIWFSATAERIYSHAVVAHVRKATVGVPSNENTHPFTYGYWTFAHNGTVTGFDAVQHKMLAETAVQFREARQGATDSETVFCWLLSRMAAAGLPPKQRCKDKRLLGRIVAEAVVQLAHWRLEAGAADPPKLNFLLTDGLTLAATRWGNSLYWVLREGVHDCEICGIPHIRHREDFDYRALVIASEPISHESWREAPDHSLLVVGEDLRPELTSIDAPVSANDR